MHRKHLEVLLTQAATTARTKDLVSFSPHSDHFSEEETQVTRKRAAHPRSGVLTAELISFSNLAIPQEPSLSGVD